MEWIGVVGKGLGVSCEFGGEAKMGICSSQKLCARRRAIGVKILSMQNILWNIIGR